MGGLHLGSALLVVPDTGPRETPSSQVTRHFFVPGETIHRDQAGGSGLRLATIGGASVLGLDHEIGTLTPGKQADIAIVDVRSPHLDGFGDPVTMLGLGAGPADVETVLVGGEFVKRDGKLLGPHVAPAREAMHEAQQRLRPAARRYLP
jgi:cytosine/adenosine deaminase-related metal-dependent hydrolase